MTSNSSLRTAGIAALGFLMACMPALAANGQQEYQPPPGGGGGCTDCEAAVDWNPVLVCDTPIQGIGGLVDCLFIDGGCNPPSQVPIGGDPSGGVLQGTVDDCIITYGIEDYLVEPLGDNGFKIFFADTWAEIDRLRFREDYPEIKKTFIEVIQPNLQAEIAEIQETPTEGLITLTLNGRSVVVNSVRCPDADCVTWDLLSKIRQEDFSARMQSDGAGKFYIVVDWDNLLRRGLFSVAFESTDEGIVASEIALEPWCAVPGGPE